MTTSVGEDLPVQQERVRVIRGHAAEIGPSGQFLVALCDQALKDAEEAAISGDVVRILSAYKRLTEFEE
jgi:hypothetical protein